MTDEQKAAHRARRYPTVASILNGLQAVHAPVAQFLATTDAALLCEKRRATWGKENTLRWMLWHLVEHDQHHRGQVFTRLRLLGYATTHDTPCGPHTVHHALWYAREHMVHHRAQIFLLMRMIGRTPPGI